MREKTEDKATTLRITDQFHAKGGMTYELKCGGDRLTLFVIARRSDADPGAWRVEARGPQSEEVTAVVAEWGETRVDALRAVARTWTTSAQSPSLPAFDWEAVATALTSVRAI